MPESYNADGVRASGPLLGQGEVLALNCSGRSLLSGGPVCSRARYSTDLGESIALAPLGHRRVGKRRRRAAPEDEVRLR